MQSSLLYIYAFLKQRRAMTYVMVAAFFAVLGWVSSGIHIEEDIARVLPAGNQIKEINQLLQRSRFADRIIIKISATENTSTERLMEIADSAEIWMRNDSALQSAEIKMRVDEDAMLEVYEVIHRNLPLYLDAEDYRQIDTFLTTAYIAEKTQSNYNSLTSASGFITKRLIADDPMGITPLALKKLQTLQLDEQYTVNNGYMFDKDLRGLYFFITPVADAQHTAQNEKLVAAIEQLSVSIKENGEADILYYGGPVVGVSNARQLKKDTILTLSITITLLLLFTFFFFRKKRVPVVMMLPVAFGALFALAIITIFKGSISSIALGAGSIVLGIAINYSIHFFSHLRHCSSVKQTIVDLLQPMTIGSFTTVGSFFSLTFLQSHILNDFGLFASLSLLGATVFALIFLPHFVDDVTSESHALHEPNWLEIIVNSGYRHQGKVFAAILLLTVFFFTQIKKVEFDSDMNHYSFLTPELERGQKALDLLQDDSTKTIFIASTAENEQYALLSNEALLKKLGDAQQAGLVKRFSSIGYFIPSDEVQKQKYDLWKAYWTDEKKEKLISELKKEGSKIGFRSDAYNHFSDVLNSSYIPLSTDDKLVLKSSVGTNLFFSDSSQVTVFNAVKVSKDKRNELYSSIAAPGIVVLDKQIITNSLVEILYSDFNRILLFTSGLVFISLLIGYASIEMTLITFLPMLITWIWILGIMGLFGLKFNLINIIISTFIFGLGDDFSIFTSDGLMKKYAEGKETLRSHKVSIVLCAITTIIGLGALIFARHPALKSIALISIIGIFCVLFIGQTVQPFLFNTLVQKRKDKGYPPYTLSSLILTIIAFTYYVAGSLLLTVIGYILVYALPFIPLKTRKLWLHHMMRACLWGLTYVMMNVRKTHIGKEQMDFSKPCIIIANHQSFLDILVTVMQHPKLILLTNHWVYYSPVFGKVVQLADYYPVMEGADPAIDKFADIVKDGYSIVVFPEGTRSADRKLKRFHKGAFYLAEKLNLDIVPMVLHGTGDTIRKGDFMVFNASMTMQFLPRITPDDTSFGIGYAERTKRISKYFKEAYEKLKTEKETPYYFRQQLRLNYLYKGPSALWHALQYTFRSSDFEKLNDMIPSAASVAFLGSGFGYPAYMIQLLSDKRNVIGYDIDSAKTDVANNGWLKNSSIEFIHADVLSADISLSDVIVIADGLLKNLSAEQKETFIGKIKSRLNENGRIIVWSKQGAHLL